MDASFRARHPCEVRLAKAIRDLRPHGLREVIAEFHQKTPRPYGTVGDRFRPRLMHMVCKVVRSEVDTLLTTPAGCPLPAWTSDLATEEEYNLEAAKQG